MPGIDFSRRPLAMWVVYDKPTDFPSEVIARKFLDGIATPEIVRAGTLEDVRQQLPSALVRFDRHPLDEPQIVELWMEWRQEFSEAANDDAPSASS